MKKEYRIGLAIAILIVIALIVRFTSQSHTPVLESNNDQTTMTTNEPTQAKCIAAVQAYLEAVKSNTIDDSKTVSSGDTIFVDYIGRLADGTVFDTSVSAVAQACGIYNSARDYDAGLDFIVGAGKVIPGFDNGVLGMQVGETKTIDIPAADAYGTESEIVLNQNEIQHPEGGEFAVGDQFATQQGLIEILAIDDTAGTITISNPNQLAGKDLIFDITIKSIS